MGLNIKNPVVEELAARVAERAGESKTEAIRVALEERLSRLTSQEKRQGGRFERWLQTSVWPTLPRAARKPLTRKEEEELLGYGPHGV